MATYWVSPTGAATWANAQSVSPLSGSLCASLATALSNIAAGDVAYLRGGTYDRGILLNGRKGTSENKITFEAYSNEVPVIENTSNTIFSGRYHGLYLYNGCEYIVINGIGFKLVLGNYFFQITQGSRYNEINSCNFDGGGTYAIINIWKGNAGLGEDAAATNNWIHSCTFSRFGTVSNGEDSSSWQIGTPNSDNVSGNNTVENCVFYEGAHHLLETFTKRNVIRANYFHNEATLANTGLPAEYTPAANGKYGNRNIQIYDGLNQDGMFNLIEANRFGYSGPPPDDDGGDGMTITAPKNIIRFNRVFASQNNGVLFKTGSGSYSDNNRFYNNTVFKSGQYQNQPQWQGYSFRWYGSYERNGNVILNNVFNTFGGAVEMNSNSGDNIIENNFLTADGDPLFIDTNTSNPFDESLPDLRVPGNSPIVGAGISLTLANGAGNASTALVVDDALFFQDGTWGSALAGLQADWIAIGTVDNVVQISSIDYPTNTITLAEAKTWDDNAPIWLYKDSSGNEVIVEGIVNIGAETGWIGPSRPTNLLVASDGPSSIDLNWDDQSSNEYGFNIERSTDGISFSQISSVASGVTSYTDTGLLGGVQYYYRIQAYNDIGVSAYSNTGSAITDSPPMPMPGTQLGTSAMLFSF